MWVFSHVFANARACMYLCVCVCVCVCVRACIAVEELSKLYYEALLQILAFRIVVNVVVKRVSSGKWLFRGKIDCVHKQGCSLTGVQLPKTSGY